MSKGIFIFDFNEVVIDKKSVFQEIAPNFTYSQKIEIFKVELKIDTPTASTH